MVPIDDNHRFRVHQDGRESIQDLSEGVHVGLVQAADARRQPVPKGVDGHGFRGKREKSLETFPARRPTLPVVAHPGALPPSVWSEREERTSPVLIRQDL
jgi:hypothetical protein